MVATCRCITSELPNLVGVLTPLLGDITSINVNWSPLQRPPDLNSPGWEGKRQHVITVSGTHASAKVLIISYATHSALALMVMRCAANLPIEAADRDKPAFVTARARSCGPPNNNVLPVTSANGDEPTIRPAARCPRAAVAARERGGPLPSIDVADALLDERRELTGLPRLTRCLVNR